MPGATSRPSNPFPSESAYPSCRTICANGHRTPPSGPILAIIERHFVKNSDEHRRYVLQKIFRFGVLEQGGVLLQFIGHLINDETAARRERVMCFTQERTFLVDLKDAEWNAGKDVIAASNPAAFRLVWQRSCIPVNHMHTPIPGKLALQVARERPVELEQEQLRIRTHPAGDLSGMHT